MSSFDFDVVIVGGGPAGVAAAVELRDRDFVILEATDRLGGRLLSYSRDQYWLNLGGHLFPGADSSMQRTLDVLGLRTIEIPGIKFAMTFESKFYKRHRIEAYPFVLPMTLKERAALVRTGLKVRRAVRGWHQAAAALPGETEAERRSRVSQYMSDRTFRQLVGNMPERVDSIFRCSARRAAAEIEIQSAGTGVSLYGAVWSGGKSTMAFNLDGGSGRLGEVAAERFHDRVRFRAQVTNVQEIVGGAAVRFTSDLSEQTITARHVILAVPAPISSEVVTGLPATVAKVLADVTYGPFLTMAVLTDETQPMPYDDVYAMTAPAESFDMFFNHANPLRRDGRRAPGGSLMVYSGAAKAQALLSESDAKIAQAYLDDLYRIFPSLRGHVVETIVQRWDRGNTFRPPGLDFAPMLNYCARTDTRIHFCGDWFGELGTMEVAASTAIEAALLVESNLDQTASV